MRHKFFGRIQQFTLDIDSYLGHRVWRWCWIPLINDTKFCNTGITLPPFHVISKIYSHPSCGHYDQYKASGSIPPFVDRPRTPPPQHACNVVVSMFSMCKQVYCMMVFVHAIELSDSVTLVQVAPIAARREPDDCADSLVLQNCRRTLRRYRLNQQMTRL